MYLTDGRKCLLLGIYCLISTWLVIYKLKAKEAKRIITKSSKCCSTKRVSYHQLCITIYKRGILVMANLGDVKERKMLLKLYPPGNVVVFCHH